MSHPILTFLFSLIMASTAWASYVPTKGSYLKLRQYDIISHASNFKPTIFSTTNSLSPDPHLTNLYSFTEGWSMYLRKSLSVPTKFSWVPLTCIPHGLLLHVSYCIGIFQTHPTEILFTENKIHF